MHFWRRDTRQHLHCIQIAEEDEDIEELPVFSFTSRTKLVKQPVMASATKLGVVKIWTPVKEKVVKPQLSVTTEIEEIDSEGLPLASSPTEISAQMLPQLPREGGDDDAEKDLQAALCELSEKQGTVE